MNDKLQNVKEIKKKVQLSLKNAPEGHLVGCMCRKKYPQYYIVDQDVSGMNKRIYVKKDKMALARALAQKEYDEKMLCALDKQERSIARYLRNVREEELNKIYESTPEAKKRLITPYIVPTNEYIEQWNQKYPGGMNGYPIENEFLTERGEKVRSKSEKMIADKLFYKNIPYQYEAPLYLKNGNRTIYPDFTMLNVRTRKTYYLEHFGLMDNTEYCKKALEKLELYEKNNIYQWDRLILTMESSTKPINLAIVDRIIKELLM